MSHRHGTFEEFKNHTMAVARGERTVDPREPKIWVERIGDGEADTIQFRSLEAGAKLLSSRNRELLRLIATREPQSVSELADMAHRAPQNVQRTLRRLSAAGIVRLSPGEGRALRPVLTVRKVHIEIDLAIA
ncbi:MAG TPA: helix-turn-helix domain-containing protein [Acetobacteraceae bacterium]|jgi:predicted transcriptional regulator